MEYKKLHNILTEILEEINEHQLFLHEEKLNPKIIELLNQKEYYITLHDVELLKPIFFNNIQKDYYGFINNHIEQKDYFFYLATIHPSSYSSLFTSVIHFRNRGNEFLNLEYKLKKYNGKYEKFRGVTKSIDVNNHYNFAISVLEKIEKKQKIDNESLSEISLLTPREKEIAILYCEKAMIEIAEELNISHNTVKTHLKSIFRKLKINNVKELTQIIKFLYP